MRFFSATAQDLILREQATVTYTANQKVAQKLGKGSWLRYMALRLRGAPTLAAASNTNALTKPGDEWAVVVRVDNDDGPDAGGGDERSLRQHRVLGRPSDDAQRQHRDGRQQ